MKLFLDTNVLLDVLAQREPWVQDSATLLALIDSGKIRGFVSAHTITTLHYLLSKHLGRERATAALVELIGLISIATVDALVIQKGLSLGWHDFKDAVQAVCALEIEADYFVTRNPQDFSALSIPVVIPSDVLQYLKL